MDTADQFDIVIRHAKGQVYAAIPRLSLFARGDTIGAALEALEQKKQEVLTEVRELGEPPLIPVGAADSSHDHRRQTGNFGTFVLKVVAATVILAIGFVVAVSLAASSVQQRFAETKIGGHAFWGKVEQQIEDAAKPDHDLPPETKAKLLADLRTIANRWRPFIEVIIGDVKASKSNGATAEPPPKK